VSGNGRLVNMTSETLDPIVSEFDTETQAASYDRWFRRMVREAMDDPRPRIPHDQAMKMVQEELAKRRTARAAR
jgi:hypothetical protein